MAKVALDAPAPDFSLEDYKGELIRLSDYEGKTAVLLVLNRGFT